MLNLVDGYPSFGLNGVDDKTNVYVAYPVTLSRGTLLLRAFFGFIYVYIPHGICLLFRFIGLYFVVLIAWWAILIIGKYNNKNYKLQILCLIVKKVLSMILIIKIGKIKLK